MKIKVPSIIFQWPIRPVKMISGDYTKMKIRTGWNAEQKKFYIQVTEKKGSKRVGDSYRIYLDQEHYETILRMLKFNLKIEIVDPKSDSDIET